MYAVMYYVMFFEVIEMTLTLYVHYSRAVEDFLIIFYIQVAQT
jgi:hypothetical protein